MDSKICFKCQKLLPLVSFYKHAQMGDGRLNKCKDCTKKDANDHRQANLEHIRAYDRLRGAMPHRVAARKEYQQTPGGRQAHQRALRKQIGLHPNRAKARNAVSNAVRDGRLIRQPCLVCGALIVEGHHPDYDRPLDVVWLCVFHHKQAHDIVREYKHAA